MTPMLQFTSVSLISLPKLVTANSFLFCLCIAIEGETLKLDFGEARLQARLQSSDFQKAT